MYSDNDGTASKETEEIYQRQKRTLCSVTSLLSALGLAAVIWSGGYGRGNMSWRKPFFVAKLLWAGFPLKL